MEVGGFVLLNVNGADLDFLIGDAVLLHSQKHVGLVLETVAVDGAQNFQIAAGDGAQTGLGIGERHAHENFEDCRGGLIAEAAAGGHVIQCKIAAAQNQMAGLQHFFAAVQRVFGVVLIITVNGDNAKPVRTVLQEVTEGVFQGGTLALVYFMVQQMDYIRMCCCLLFKIVQVLRLAAIVDQNDVGKAIFQQTVNDGMELFVGIQRGQNHRNFG